MPLFSAGTRLGSFEILAPIGAGEMGEVYRARDTRLDRDVAVKILAGHIAREPHSHERFEREARAASRLNHPHICTLHDVGSADIGGLDHRYRNGARRGGDASCAPAPRPALRIRHCSTPSRSPMPWLRPISIVSCIAI